jgi:hypothetical protein
VKQANALLPLFFQCCLRINNHKSARKEKGMKWNRRHKLPFYTLDVNLLTNNINSTHRNTEALLNASKEVGPDVGKTEN